MAPKGKQPAAGAAQADLKARGRKLLDSYAGVPTTFFGVQTDGGRYLAEVTQLHATKATMVWLRFVADRQEVHAPIEIVEKWVISDEEANDPNNEWFEDDSDDEEEFEDEQAPPAPAAGGASDSVDVLRGSVKSGRWKPAASKKLDHAIDTLTWRKASGAVPSHKPTIFSRTPSPEITKPSLQVELDPTKPMLLQLFRLQWDDKCWDHIADCTKKKRIEHHKIGTPEAQCPKPNMNKRNPGTKGRERPVPAFTHSFLIRLHVATSLMGIIRLPARKYYWSRASKLIGNAAFGNIMSSNEFSQGWRCIYDCDVTTLVRRGDKRQPPPVGYDKMAKTRPLETMVMANTLNAMQPPEKLSDDECSSPYGGKNGEGVAIAFNKDKPHKWATRIQTFNALDGSRVVWHVLNCPRRIAAEHGETMASTLALTKMLFEKYGGGFSVGQDSLYNSPVVCVEGAVLYNFNFYGTAVFNRRGMVNEPEQPDENTRGASVTYYTVVKSGGKSVPLTHTLFQDNSTIRWCASSPATVSSKHGVPTASTCVGTPGRTRQREARGSGASRKLDRPLDKGRRKS